jgi:hypothetical protein
VKTARLGDERRPDEEANDLALGVNLLDSGNATSGNTDFGEEGTEERVLSKLSDAVVVDKACVLKAAPCKFRALGDDTFGCGELERCNLSEFWRCRDLEELLKVVVGFSDRSESDRRRGKLALPSWGDNANEEKDRCS